MIEHRARKRFGQNFLHDPAVIQRIVRAIAPQPGDHLVEIGPGLGALTAPLLAASGRLDVIELDRDLAAHLPVALAGQGELVVHQADALRFDFSRLAGGGRLRVVGNLPYNISTPLLFHLFAQHDVIDDMHFMLQREVVDRLVARPGQRGWSRLSVMAAWYVSATYLLDVGPGAFRPAPKVDSAVVRLIPHAHPPSDAVTSEALARVVTAAFSQRRKTLRNSLRNLLDEAAIRAAGVDPLARVERLSLDDFVQLTRQLP